MEYKWNRRFLELAKHVSTWSKDPSTQVGAVLVNGRREVVSVGYNGFARNVFDLQSRYEDRPTKYKFIVHAEVNAIVTAGERARGATLYVYPSFGIPCICQDCAKMAIQAGVTCVVGYIPKVSKELQERWKDSLATSSEMFTEAGVAFYGIPEDVDSRD
jgi:dCMP deaminase